MVSGWKACSEDCAEELSRRLRDAEGFHAVWLAVQFRRRSLRGNIGRG